MQNKEIYENVARRAFREFNDLLMHTGIKKLKDEYLNKLQIAWRLILYLYGT